jgi:hypothetical protein
MVIKGGSRSIRECNEQVSVAAPEWMKTVDGGGQWPASIIRCVPYDD